MLFAQFFELFVLAKIVAPVMEIHVSVKMDPKNIASVAQQVSVVLSDRGFHLSADLCAEHGHVEPLLVAWVID